MKKFNSFLYFILIKLADDPTTDELNDSLAGWPAASSHLCAPGYGTPAGNLMRKFLNYDNLDSLLGEVSFTNKTSKQEGAKVLVRMTLINFTIINNI